MSARAVFIDGPRRGQVIGLHPEMLRTGQLRMAFPGRMRARFCAVDDVPEIEDMHIVIYDLIPSSCAGDYFLKLREPLEEFISRDRYEHALVTEWERMGRMGDPRGYEGSVRDTATYHADLLYHGPMIPNEMRRAEMYPVQPISRERIEEIYGPHLSPDAHSVSFANIGDEEIEEWNKILHPENYEDTKGKQ